MPVLLITFTEVESRQNVEEVVRFIRSHEWARLGPSVYAIVSKHPAQDVYDAVSRIIDNNDGLFVMTLTPDWWGYSPHPDVTRWLRTHLG